LIFLVPNSAKLAISAKPENSRAGTTRCTIGYGGSGIMAKKFGVFCTKICYFIEENKTQKHLWAPLGMV
jgi:hypothetical protein